MISYFARQTGSRSRNLKLDHYQSSPSRGYDLSNVDEQEIKEQTEAFIREQWLVLASVGWRSYMHNNKPGAVVLGWEHLELWSRGKPFRWDPAFITFHDSPVVQNAIDTYDPKESIVVYFTSHYNELQKINPGDWCGDDSSDYYQVVSLDPPPPQAHLKRAN